jgi:hypothetical protein
VDFDVTDKLLITHSVLSNISGKKGECNEAVLQKFIDFKKAYDSVTKEVLCNILIEFFILMKLERLIKMCLTETYTRIRIGNNLSDMFPIRNGLKGGDALSPLLFNFALEYAIRRVQVNQDGFKVHTSFWLMPMMLIYWEEAYIL